MSASIFLATLNLMVGGLVFLLGLVILRENSRQKLNRAVAFMLFFGGLGSIVTAIDFITPAETGPRDASFIPTVSQNFSYLWEFFFPTLLVFASVFPRERSFRRKVRSFELLVYLPHAFHFLLLLGLSLAGPRIETLSLDVPGVLRPFASLLELVFELFLAIHTNLFSLVNLGYGLASATLLVLAYREASVRKLRQQLGVIGGGLTLGLVLYSLSSLIPALFGLEWDRTLRAVLTVGGLTVISAAIAYSMVRYKFLDTKLLARRGILYAVASAVVVGLYLVVLDQFNRFFGDILGATAQVVEPVLLIIALILFQPVISRLEELLEQVFLRDPGDYRNVVRKLGKDLLTSIELEDMLERSITTLAEAMLLKRACVVALPREAPLAKVGAGPEVAPEALDALAGLLHRIPESRDSVRVFGNEDTLGEADIALLVREFGASLLFPLRSKGETVGALLLGEKVTGTDYTSEDVALLHDLAAQMSVSLQNGLLLQDRVAVARLEEELTLARNIQTRFLPSEFPVMPRFEVFGRNTPSREVGGDFYDVVPAGDDAFFLVIADVSGKGMGAALLTSMLQASLRTQAETERRVSQILKNLNALLCRSTPAEQFVTVFLAHVDQQSGAMTYANGGHNYPFVLRRGHEPIYLEEGGMLLGMFDGAEFEEGTLRLLPGDRAVFFTDGINEALNAEDEEYGEERLVEILRGVPDHLSARDVTDHILADHRRFLNGVEAQDDVTVMVLRAVEPREAPGDGELVGADATVKGRGRSSE